MHLQSNSCIHHRAGNKAVDTRQEGRAGLRVKRRHDAGGDAADTAHVSAKQKVKTQKGVKKQRKAKPASRVGLINPTAEEIQQAFSQFNPHNKSVINAQDIARV